MSRNGTMGRNGTMSRKRNDGQEMEQRAGDGTMDSRRPSAPLRYCPTCRDVVTGNTQSATCFPFCSDRCQLLDLGRWLNEDYRIPANDHEQ